jgi:hypothetical protein
MAGGVIGFSRFWLGVGAFGVGSLFDGGVALSSTYGQAP